MVVGTRSGRITKEHGQQPSIEASKRLPTATVYRRGAQGPRARGRGRGGRTSRVPTSHATAQHIEKSFEQAIQPYDHQSIQAPPAPKVQRITTNTWQSQQPTIAFVQYGSLDTNSDTEIIALNIIDHFLRPENWDKRLSFNILSTSAFYFASLVTEKQNTPEQIARSFIVDPAFVYSMAINMYGFADAFGVQKMAEMLSVRKERVREGFVVLWERKGDLEEIVGGYKEKLKEMVGPEEVVEALKEEGNSGRLPGKKDDPRNDLIKNIAPEDDDLLLFELDDSALDVSTPEEKASEVDLDLVDFDVDDTDPW